MPTKKPTKKSKSRVSYRDAATGEYVAKSEAKRRPKETVREKRVRGQMGYALRCKRTKELRLNGEGRAMTAERELELLNELTWSDICAGYSARELWEALVERIAERTDTEEMELRVVLDEIAERLEERETMGKRCCPHCIPSCVACGLKGGSND